MTDEQIRRILDDDYDPSRENPLMSMARDFYSRRMLSIALFVWFWGLLFIAGAVYSGIQFFKVDQTRAQIMYATIFTCSFICVAFMKVFAWQMIHRTGITREIKRLELRIAQLGEKDSKA
jgi:hypothetical protein